MLKQSLPFRARSLLFGGVVALAIPVLPPVSHAQVVTNSDALSELKPSGDGPAKTAKPAHRATRSSSVQQRAVTAAPHPVTRSAPMPAIPAAPPPNPVFVPASVYVPVHALPTPADVAAIADAKGDAKPITGGVRLTFGAGSADLNAPMRQAVLDFAKVLLAHSDARVDIDSYADGSPDDLSTPRRVSLARGLAVRAIMMHAGVPSTRIYVRPIGLLHAPDLSPDRLDMTRSDVVPAHRPDATPTDADPTTGKAAQ